MPPSRGRAALGRFSPFEPALEVLGDDFVERRLWRKGNVDKRPRPAGMGATVTPRLAAATRTTRRESPARTIRPG